jgi:hypothetical protein
MIEDAVVIEDAVAMGSAKSDHLRAQAERCLRLARALLNRADAERLRRLGEDLLEQAERTDKEGADEA